MSGCWVHFRLVSQSRSWPTGKNGGKWNNTIQDSGWFGMLTASNQMWDRGRNLWGASSRGEHYRDLCKGELKELWDQIKVGRGMSAAPNKPGINQQVDYGCRGTMELRDMKWRGRVRQLHSGPEPMLVIIRSTVREGVTEAVRQEAISHTLATNLFRLNKTEISGDMTTHRTL